MVQTLIATSGDLSTAARLAEAARTVALVTARGQALNETLLGRDGPRMHSRDAAAVQALTYGTLRWYSRIDYWIERLVQPDVTLQPQIRALLAIGLHQLGFSGHPAHAIVDQAVEAARALRQPRAAGLVNAVLRRFLREQVQLKSSALAEPVARFSHPAWLIEAIRRDWPEHFAQILDANNEPAPLWLRVNTRQTTREDYLRTLTSAGIGAEPGPFSAEAVRLEFPMDVLDLPGFTTGAASVQDAGAQLAADFLEAHAGMRVLDACAAPGGKTCHLLERADLQELVAIDRSASRMEQLRVNLERLRLDASIVVADAAETSTWWDGRGFDRILLDVPCSASGVIRRHPDIKLLRRADDLEQMGREQLRLLRALWPLLREGGRLLYATCSVLQVENESVVQIFREAEPWAATVPVPGTVASFAQRTAGGVGIQILPGAAGMDGFYYACLERRRPEPAGSLSS